ncbi:haloacid dehalogenase [Pseudalgibacter alginicilyticus]|uniref:Haloacid dehalogenase n=1 Tax=Pseudalgibacter alginicilyticus TaxID=1736674 RepID=A0A0P0DB54_9FLAO|nr:YjjG family noncanonical pyrimidine nucleotidase [Pseudalgibacter alginicilyticus]ALJ06149.1 haloacid dehalogenase [Pseudalgibacter alginicilyticus]
MKIEGITDVFFDLDHTLWDFDKNSALTFKTIFELNKIEVDIDMFLHHYIIINFNYWKLFRDEKIDKEVLRFKRLNDTFMAINHPILPEIINKLSKDYIEHLTNYNYLYENTIEVLDYLKQKYRLHIISNGFHEVQNKKLENSNIQHYFKTVTNGESIGVKKPNPKIFNHALDCAKTSAKTSIMIGDGFEADIIGAMNVGMEVIFFGTNKENSEVEVKQISNLIQLKNYL